jgi:hypothetical protein
VIGRRALGKEGDPGAHKGSKPKASVRRVLTPLLVEVGVVMTAVVMMAVYDYHYLRLRRIRYCEAEKKNQRKQNLFHALV